MLISIAMMFLVGMSMGWICKKIHLPSLFGMIVTGIVLFVLVGATVDIRYAVSAGVVSIVLIFVVLVFRMLGVFLCLLKTKLTMKERMFCVIAYMPKATVQAAIGGVPLAMGLSCGNIVLTVAVTAILITAPLGAFLIEATYKKWLGRQTEILSR